MLTIVAQSRDRATIMRNLEIGTQSQDPENAQRNLEIAQILRLRGTYILKRMKLIGTSMSEPHTSELNCIFYMHIMAYGSMPYVGMALKKKWRPH